MARTFNKRPDKVQKAFDRLANNRRNRIANRFEEMTDDESSPWIPESSYSRSDRKDEPSHGEEERSRTTGFEL